MTMLALFTVIYLLYFCQANVQQIYYVATNGSDTNPGTITAPFATLNHARDAIRNLKTLNNGKLMDGNIIVYIRGGQYFNTNYSKYNEPLLFLNALQDSGQPNANIIYSGYHSEKVELFGGYNIPSSSFKQSSTNNNLLVSNLSELNNKLWDNIDFGMIKGGASYALVSCLNDRSELFVNNKRMILSRWPNIYINNTYNPNIELFNWTNILNVTNNQTSFQYSDEIDNNRAKLWLNELIQRNNTNNSVWLHGYWYYDWADNFVELEDIDINKQQMFTNPNTPPVYGYNNKARFMAINLLSELDTIDEYFFDTVNKLVYINKQRKNTLSTDNFMISVNPYVISLNGNANKHEHINFDPLYSIRHIRNDTYKYQHHTQQFSAPPELQYISIENLTIGYATTSAIFATNVAYVNVSNVHIFGIGELGLSLNGYNNTISNNYITGIGCGGVSVIGGSENELIRGNNVVSNNQINYYAEWKRTYEPGITFGGVGNIYKNNIISNAPHEGIIGSGNDFLFDNNTFINLAYEVSDAGAWHVGRSWAHRGTILSNNLFINITTIEKIYLGYPVISGIYLDDQLSGHNITNNTFFNVNLGIKIGGGRRNIVWNNYFAKCTFGVCVTYDDRGLTWQTSYCSPGGYFQQQLEAVNYTQPPWSIHYPELPNIFNEQPCVPVYDNVYNNTFCCGKGESENQCKFIDDNNKTINSWNSSVSNNIQIDWSAKYC